MRILFDSLKTEHKTPFGCLRVNEECRLTVYIPVSCQTASAQAVITRDDGFSLRAGLEHTKTQDGYDYYSGSFSLPECGLYFYHFEITTPVSSFRLFRQGRHDTNMEEGEKWQLTCFEALYDTPSAFKGKVMYQIFPDRFNKCGECDTEGKLTPFYMHESTDEIPNTEPDENGKYPNNDFFGGNLRGITEKLDYLKELGVGVIYLNPIFKAYSNHRYDTADYMSIDPLLGTEADFVELCSKAHSCGIKILLDGVFSHTGDNSIYFDRFYIFGNGAVSNPDSPYKDWYTFSEFPGKYTAWWGIESLPCVDETQKSYTDFIINSNDSVIEHWLSLGADGFRLDVADELPDSFIKMLHKRVKEIKPDALVLGEVWEDASNKTAYSVRRRYFVDTELDSVMNYPFKNAIIAYALGEKSAEELKDVVMTICENYPKPVLDCLMNSLSTHDTARILTVLGKGDFSLSKRDKANFSLSAEALDKAMELERLCAFLQYMLPGSACIYYGDEIGMEGFEDPLNRGYFKWDRTGSPLRDFYCELGKIKNGYAVFRDGDFCVKDCRTAFVAERKTPYERLTVIANTHSEPYVFPLEGGKIVFSQNTDIFGSTVKVGKNGFALIV